MKLQIKRILQRLLGVHGYLVIFAIYKIFTLRFDRGDRDFLQFRTLIPDTGIALDVGANIGIMTVLLSRRLRRGQVIAFEPMPANFRVLETITQLFGLKNVTLYPWALSNADGTLNMVMPVVENVRLQGIAHVIGADDGEVSDNEGDYARVVSKRLDDLSWLPQDAPAVTSIKIDVEGHEFFMLQGAEAVLDRYRPLVYCEISRNEHRASCLKMFESRGYRTQVIVNGARVDFDPDLHDDQAFNFIFLPPPD